MSRAAPVLMDDLLANAGFVRGMASAILRGDRETDDVVQDTFVAALEHGPRASREPGALRSWLRVVATNLARRVLRSRARRDARERRAARADTTRSVAEIAEREETRRRLVAAVLSLEEPYRSTIVLRFYDEMPVASVAERMGVPLETARTRLRRGLERLRERLIDRGHPDRRARALGLASWALWPASPVAPAVLGGLVVKKLAVVAALVLVVGLATWGVMEFATSRETDGSGRAPSLAAGPGQTTGISSDAPALAAKPGGSTGEAGVSKAALPFASGVVVDETGAPVAGAIVVARVRRRFLMTGSGTEMEHTWVNPSDSAATELARTSADGRFAIADAIPAVMTLVVWKADFAASQTVDLVDLVERREQQQELRVVLHPGRALAGTIRDTDGRPVAGAQVSPWIVDAPAEARWPEFRTFSGEDGRYALPFLPMSRLRFFVTAPGMESRIVEGDEAFAHPDFVLKRIALVVDVVDDAGPLSSACAILVRPDGTPVAAAAPIDTNWFPAHDGRLVLPLTFVAALANDAALDGELVVIAPDHLPARVAVSLRASVGPPPMRVVLARGAAEASIAGRVEGALTATIEVRLPMPEGFGAEDDPMLVVVATTTTASDGRFALAVPPGRYRLAATAPGFGRVATDVTAPAAGVFFALRPAASLEVKGRTLEGEPTPGAWFTVVPKEGRWTWRSHADAGGVARFEQLPAGAYRVVPAPSPTSGSGWSRTAPWSVVRTIAPGAHDTVDCLVPSRIPVRFVVRDDEGSPRTGATITLVGTGVAHDPQRVEWERVEGLRPTTDATGTARVELYPGEYSCTVTQGSSARKSLLAIPFEREPVVNLVLSIGDAEVRGRVVDRATGAPIAGARVRAYLPVPDPTGSLQTSATTADDGSFALTGLPPGALRVLVSTSVETSRGASPYPYAEVDVTLARRQRQTIDFALPRIRGERALEPAVELTLVAMDATSRQPLSKARASVLARFDGIWIAAGDVEAGSDGRGAAKVLAADRYRVRVSRWQPGQPVYRTKEFEVAATDGRVAVQALLAADDDSDH